jgi:predicted transcriptional regulator
VDLESGDVILLYDVHRGKSHDRHLRGKETRYRFVNEDTLLDDFLPRRGSDSGGQAMSARRLKIGIRTSTERSKALREALHRVARGERAPQEPRLYFESVEELRQILTEKRLEVLLAITRHRPASVHELAGLLERNYKNVSTDIALLERLGLVRLEAKGGKGRAQVPTVPYDEIQVTIDLRQPRAAHDLRIETMDGAKPAPPTSEIKEI